VDEQIERDTPSDPFLFSGFHHCGVHLTHDDDQPVTFRCEVDLQGDGNWSALAEVSVPATGYSWHQFAHDDQGVWIRIMADRDCRATAWFEMRNLDRRTAAVTADSAVVHDPFAGMSEVSNIPTKGGLLRAGDQNTGLHIVATSIDGDASEPQGYYQLKPDLSLIPIESDRQAGAVAQSVSIPAEVLTVVGHSILYVDDDGQRFRIPIGNPAFLKRPELLGIQRTSREAVTERDVFQAGGTFYELPARNAGGFAKIRPIATHPLLIQDYCSWRGLLVMSGVAPDAGPENPHIIRSSDGGCAVWLGAIDDLWELGKPVGTGGPWNESAVKAGQPSDPYLMAGYDQKSAEFWHDAENAVQFAVEVDISGTGLWQTFHTLEVEPDQVSQFAFPDGFQAYWVRLIVNQDCVATAQFRYE
jgi:hypothetical protein